MNLLVNLFSAGAATIHSSLPAAGCLIFGILSGSVSVVRHHWCWLWYASGARCLWWPREPWTLLDKFKYFNGHTLSYCASEDSGCTQKECCGLDTSAAVSPASCAARRFLKFNCSVHSSDFTGHFVIALLCLLVVFVCAVYIHTLLCVWFLPACWPSRWFQRLWIPGDISC